MAGINKAILVGHLGRDPELKYTPGGQPVATFTLATSERFNDKNGQRQDRTEWHNIVVWGKQAELANQYLKKGRLVGVEGRISTRAWDDKDGVKKYKTEIVVTNLTFLGSATGAGGTGSSNGASYGGGGASYGNAAPASNPYESSAPASNPYDAPSFPDSPVSMDDDLPF
jgi:single-strand DNA-binding protein